MPHKNRPGASAFEFAYNQIDRAIVAGYYLEAVAIEDAILRERLFRACKETGMRTGRKSTTLRMIIHHLRRQPVERFSPRCLDILNRAETLVSRQETCLDMLSKHDERAPRFDIAAFNQLAQCAAVEGKELVLMVITQTELNGIGKAPEVQNAQMDPLPLDSAAGAADALVLDLAEG